MKQRFPEHDQTSRRILAQAALSLVFILLTLLVIQILLNILFGQAILDLADIAYSIKPSILATLLIPTIAEVSYFFGRWKAHCWKQSS